MQIKIIAVLFFIISKQYLNLKGNKFYYLMNLRSEETSLNLINRLNDLEVNYAIARNYENYPSFNHDLDLFFDGSLYQFQKIIFQVKEECGWDKVKVCNHWGTSKFREQNINSFLFISTNPFEQFRVDLFGGFLAMGIPLVKANDLVKNRIFDSDNKFFKIDPTYECLFCILQISSLLKNKSLNKEKIVRYRKKAINLYSKITCKNKSFPVSFQNLYRLVEHIKSENFIKLQRRIFIVKSYFLISQLITRPIKSAKYLYMRVIQLLNLYFFNPCGIVITIPYRLNENQIREIETVFNTLKKAKFLPFWCLTTKNKKQSSLPLYFLERGGIALKEHKRSKKSQNLNLKDFKQGLINKIINRHVDLEDLL